MSILLSRMGILAKQVVEEEGGGGGTPIYDPADSSPVLWGKPEALAAVGNGNPISLWPGTSVADDFSQASSGARPTARSNSLDGFFAAEFDGSDFLRAITPSSFTSDIATFMAVVRADAVPSWAMIMALESEYGELRFNPSRHLEMVGIGEYSQHGVAANLGSWYIVNGVISGTGVGGLIQTRLNGGSAVDAAPSNTQGVTGNWRVGLGARLNGSLFWNGKIAEWLVWNKSLTLTELNHIGADYLALKFPSLTWNTAT